jgi:hypothetical protein
MDKQNPSDSGSQPKIRIKKRKKGVLDNLPQLMSQRFVPDPGALMRPPNFVEDRSAFMLRLVGYVLLVLALFDYASILLPPRLTDPFWEFQTLGQLVERVPVPLLGLLLVFYRHATPVQQKELSVLKFLSWLSLIVGVFYLLMLPLGILSTYRIYDGRNTQLDIQRSQQSQQIQKTREQLTSSTDKQIADLISTLSNQGRVPKTNNPDEFRRLLLNELEKTEQTAQMQANLQLRGQTKELVKNSIKWNLGTIIGGVTFIWIWRLTHWMRSPRLVTRFRKPQTDVKNDDLLDDLGE